MSGDLTNVQCEMLTNEFIDTLKSLSVSQLSSSHADTIEKLHNQFKCGTSNGLQNNKAFASAVVDNFYRIVPLFARILSNNDINNDFIQTKAFLETLANTFNDICLFEVLIMFKDTPRFQTIFQDYVTLLNETYFTDNNKYDILVNCILPIVGFSSLLIQITEDQIPGNLLSYLLTFTKRYWQCRHREGLVKNILCLIKIFSKKPTLIPLIIRNEWPHACVQWLIITNTEHDSRPSYVIDYYICIILQKIARHPLGVQVLNELNCLKALHDSKEQMRKSHIDVEYKCLQFLQCMIYALLMEADEIKQLSVLTDSEMCQALDKVVLFTIEASRDEHFFYQCFHISEILSVLCKIFVNDDILTKCINGNNQLFDCLCQLLIHFTNITGDKNRIPQPADDETLLSLTNLLWSISFHQCYHEKFQTNSTLMHTLSNLATLSSLYTSTQTSSIPRDLSSLKKAAEGILWNLKSSSSSRPILKPSNETAEQRPLAMISYSHSDAVF